GKTLIPSLIDAHVHMVFGSLTMAQMMAPNMSEEVLINNVGVSSQQMLMRGFTSVRDAGGPIFPLKSAIDKGKILGPRIWPSGATISQTAGDRKSTRLNSSHVKISYAVFCLKKKINK